MSKRTIQERIQELEAKIAAIKARDERKQARARPEVKHLVAALRWTEKAIAASEDPVLRKALEEARLTIQSCADMLGVKLRSLQPVRRRAKAQAVALDAVAVLTYIKNNSGMKGEAIAAEFATDTATLRPVLKQLAADGAIKSEGKGRGTVYLTAGKRQAVAAG